MSKIAVLISGEYRTFSLTRPTMTFLNNESVDVYISTWDRTVYSLPKLQYQKIEIVTPTAILKDLRRPATILVERSSSFPRNDRYNNKMIHRWLSGFKLIKDSGINYDYVVVIRPDIIFNKDIPITLDAIDKYESRIGFAWHNSLSHTNKLQDVLFMSSFDKIDTLFQNLSIDAWEIGNNPDWHTWWFNFGTSQGLEFVDMPEFNSSTFCRMWATKDHSFREIVDLQHDWRDLVLLNQIDLIGEDAFKDIWPKHVIMTAKEKWNSGYFEKYK